MPNVICNFKLANFQAFNFKLITRDLQKSAEGLSWIPKKSKL